MKRITQTLGHVLWAWMTRNVETDSIGDPFAVSLD